MSNHYDLLVVGTGFASAFFLRQYLAARPKAKVLVLERGQSDPHSWQVANRRASSFEHETIKNVTPEKPWRYSIGFGGGSNCWWACVPRFMPNDFRSWSAYRVGADWPISYEEVEPYYVEVEKVMSVSGDERTPFPKSAPYPQPPHRLSDPDNLLRAAYPDHFFVQPTARPSRPTERRPRCCANGTCTICPIDSKFTIANEMYHLFHGPGIQLELGAEARSLSVAGSSASFISYRKGGQARRAHADLFVLGANAFFNTEILLRTGLDHPQLGRGLVEQVSRIATVRLEGVDNFQGSTSVTGHGYMLYDGPHRKRHAACLIETSSTPGNLRAEWGRWRQTLEVKFIFEDLRSDSNFLQLSDGLEWSLPEVRYEGFSSYTQRGLDSLEENIESVLSPLPVEEIEWHDLAPTESHIVGTTVMGRDPAKSVVDPFLVHHAIRNLVVLGAGSFPTCPPANPTLTLSALSLRSADHLLS